MSEIKKVQAKLLDMMHRLVMVLDEHRIPYYVCAGTQLGAVRHKGFIPWDDDIDIMIPRPDYERLIQLARANDLKLGEGLEARSIELGNARIPFLKVIDPQVEIVDLGQVDRINKLWIDVFPMEGLPSDASERVKFYRKARRIQKSFLIGYNSLAQLIKITKRKRQILVKWAVHVGVRAYGLKRLARKLVKHCSRYDFEQAEYVGLVMWSYGEKEAMLKADLWTRQYEFCDMKVKGVGDYDRYLKNSFGEYMILPPVDQRKTHGVKLVCD